MGRQYSPGWQNSSVPLGVEHIFAGVANPDNCPIEWYEDFIKGRRGVECPGRGQPHWTHERIDEVRKWAQPVLVDDPLGTSGWTTYQALFEIVRRIPEEKWGRLVGISGDYIFETAFLTEIVEQAVYPSICWLEPIHEMLFLDRDGLEVFLEYQATHSRAEIKSRLTGVGGGRREQLLYGMRGKDVWEDRCKLEDELRIRSWTPGHFHRYTHSTHRHDELVRFEEIGVSPNGWHRACLIEKEDPI